MPEQATEPGVVGRGHLQKSLKGRRTTMVSLGGVIEAGLFVGGVAVMSTRPTARQSVFRRKPVDAFVAETRPDAEGGELSRSIGLFQLTMFGVGATIGTGIFIVLSAAVPEAGPGVIVSFVLAGITAALTAVCYAELASTIPVSGSSYSYTYATMGEIPRVESSERRETKEF
jgi:amino acid permease